MDFSIAGKDGDFVVLTTHTTGPGDRSPLQMISAARLAELEKIEADYLADFAAKASSATPKS